MSYDLVKMAQEIKNIESCSYRNSGKCYIFEVVLNNIELSVLILDRHWNVTFWNQATSILLGVNPEDKAVKPVEWEDYFFHLNGESAKQEELPAYITFQTKKRISKTFRFAHNTVNKLLEITTFPLYCKNKIFQGVCCLMEGVDDE